MNYLVRARKKNNYFKKSVLSAVLLMFLFAGVVRMPAAAADSEVIFEEESENAEKGHIYIRAAVEKDHEIEIAVDLYAGFDGGGFHHYVLGPENHYGVSDDIAIGEYICSPYIAESREGKESSKAYVEYGGNEQIVTQDGITCFLVVAGSREFVNDYIWLSEFRDENGNYVSGVISRDDAEKILTKTIAMQDSEEQEGTYLHDNELVAEEGTSEDAAPEIVSPKPMEDGDTAPSQWSYMLGAGTVVTAVFIIAALLIVIIKKQGFKNGRGFHDG